VLAAEVSIDGDGWMAVLSGSVEASLDDGGE
jgi:hypothetical protein